MVVGGLWEAVKDQRIANCLAGTQCSGTIRVVNTFKQHLQSAPPEASILQSCLRTTPSLEDSGLSLPIRCFTVTDLALRHMGLNLLHYPGVTVCPDPFLGLWGFFPHSESMLSLVKWEGEKAGWALELLPIKKNYWIQLLLNQLGTHPLVLGEPTLCTRDEVMTTAKLKGLLGDAAFVGTRDVCADGKQGKLTGLQQITGQRCDRQSAIFKI